MSFPSRVTHIIIVHVVSVFEVHRREEDDHYEEIKCMLSKPLHRSRCTGNQTSQSMCCRDFGVASDMPARVIYNTFNF